jgi:hypothetical protein
MSDAEAVVILEPYQMARAFLRVIQAGNACEVTGKLCRDERRCGCWLELLGHYGDAHE